MSQIEKMVNQHVTVNGSRPMIVFLKKILHGLEPQPQDQPKGDQILFTKLEEFVLNFS